MALLSVIRRGHFREGMPTREIERRTGLSRNTIRKYLRAGDVEPKFKVPARPSQLDAFAGKLTAWLRGQTSKSRKQRRAAKQVHADLVVLGYGGSYNRVAAFVRDWKAERQRAAIYVVMLTQFSMEGFFSTILPSLLRSGMVVVTAIAITSVVVVLVQRRGLLPGQSALRP